MNFPRRSMIGVYNRRYPSRRYRVITRACIPPVDAIRDARMRADPSADNGNANLSVGDDKGRVSRLLSLWILQAGRSCESGVKMG